MIGLIRRAVRATVALAGVIVFASPALAQSRGGGWCPPGQAKKGRCDDWGSWRSRRSDGWCWDRNRDGRCDGVYDRRRDDDVYERNGPVYDRLGRIYDRNRRIYDRNGRVINDREVYDRGGRVTTGDPGKDQIRRTVGDLIDRVRTEARNRR